MKRIRRAPARKAYRSVPAGVPPVAPRRGVNSQKASAARGELKRARRTGFLRRAFSFLRTLAVAILAAGALGGGGYAAWRAFEDSGLLVLREVDVVGNNLRDSKDILEKAGVELGVKLPFIRTAAVEEAVRALPGVADVSVSRVFPSRLEIRVQEQAPVAFGYVPGGPGVLRSAGAWRGLAPDGSVIPGLDLRQSDLPVVDGFGTLGPGSRAKLGAFLESVRTGHPELYASFSQLTLKRPAPRPSATRKHGRKASPEEPEAAAGQEELEIVLRDGRLKVLIEMGNKSLTSLEFLQALLDQQRGSLSAGKTVDLRVEGYAYVR
jgi:hypothetical protein